ncbi:HAMP domain-containing sensor histidine kinase [Streptomyces sp. NPDC051907]|uniref:HAMP domain-containing sensor histidine kinase n=1 Tax=Streptomyces sp. NPDC051907 TaxID=3155284 RepID=UPI0034244C16
MRLSRLGSLRTRLVATFVLVALVSAVTATVLAYRESRTAILKRAQDSFQSDFRDRVGSVAADFDVPPDVRSLTLFADRVSQGVGGDAKVVARFRDLKATSDSLADESRITVELRTAVRTEGRLCFQRVEYEGEPYLVVGTPVTFATGTEAGAGTGGGTGAVGDGRTAGQPSGLEVFAITSMRAEQEDTAGLLDAVRDGIITVVALAAVLALLAARTVLRPVRDLGRATRRLAEGDLATRVPARGSDELADLARDFNDTADALQSSVAELRDQEATARRFVADVSHELRTPLAAMTMVATVLDEDADELPPDAARAARTVSAETARLARLVDDLMEMSRFDAGAATLNAREVDLAETIRSTLALRGWLSEVDARLPQGVRVVLDPRRIDVVVANLVGNALRHGSPPVTVTVTLVADDDGAQGDGRGLVSVEVADRGPGLAPEAVSQVFDRFYKADTARSRSEGSGLGMAIAWENARLHGGTIEVANRPEGGAVFTLRLPRELSTEEAS